MKEVLSGSFKNRGAVAVERAGIDTAMQAVVDAPFPPPRWPGGAPQSCRDLHDQPGWVHSVIYQNPVWGQSQHKRLLAHVDCFRVSDQPSWQR
jgi:hypothetical protein